MTTGGPVPRVPVALLWAWASVDPTRSGHSFRFGTLTRPADPGHSKSFEGLSERPFSGRKSQVIAPIYCGLADRTCRSKYTNGRTVAA
jgi:hypothetical protein